MPERPLAELRAEIGHTLRRLETLDSAHPKVVADVRAFGAFLAVLEAAAGP